MEETERRSALRATRWVVFLGVAAGVATVSILLTGSDQRDLPLTATQARGFVVPVPRGWSVDLRRAAPTVLFAHPVKGAGQESLRVAVASATTSELATAYVEVSRDDTPNLHTQKAAVSGVRGGHACWLVDSRYRLPRDAAFPPLESLDLFCVRQQGSIAHVNLVVPTSDAGGNLARRWEQGLTL
jgi:hypothetical protein